MANSTEDPYGQFIHGLTLDPEHAFTPIEPEQPSEPSEPTLSAVNPMWLPPLCNAGTEDAVYIWYKLVYGGGNDLEPQECGDVQWGGMPNWWDQTEDKSLDSILGPPWTLTKYGSHDFTDQWIRWALENGIAPGQPFLICIGMPQWYRCSYEYDEWDCDQDAQLVRALPRTPAQALRAWSRTLDRVRRYYDLYTKKFDRLRFLQDTDLAALTLKTSNYGRYNEGLRVTLCSAHNSMWGATKQNYMDAQLVSGDNDEGKYALAFRNLLKNIKKYRPRISIPAVCNIHRYSNHPRVGITRWEMLSNDDFGPALDPV